MKVASTVYFCELRDKYYTRELRAFLLAVFASSTVLGFMSFGPFVLVLFPLTFSIGLCIATVTAGPALLFLARKEIKLQSVYLLVGCLIGFLVPFIYAVFRVFISVDFQPLGRDLAPLLLTSLVSSAVYGFGGWIFWLLCFHPRLALRKPSKP